MYNIYKIHTFSVDFISEIMYNTYKYISARFSLTERKIKGDGKLGIIYYYHANPIGDTDKEHFMASPTALPYDCNHTGYFSDRIYNSRNLNSRFYVISFGYQIGWNSASVRERLCNRYTIHFTFDGTEEFNGKKVVAGDIFIALPNEKYSIHIQKQDRCVHGWIALSGKELEAMIDLYHLPKESILHIPTERMEKIRQIFLDTIYVDHSDLNMPYYLFAQFFQVLSVAAIPLNNHDVNNVYVNRSLEFISNNYSKDITISDIANAVNISNSYLRKLFAKELHLSPQTAITQKRIAVPKALLQNQNLQVNLIAEMCGFSDQSAFSKAFKKKVGVSPLDYRKSKMGAER